MTKNCDKSILVIYLDVENVSRQHARLEMVEVLEYTKGAFNPMSEDDSMVILVFPSDRTEVKLFNPNCLNVTDEEIKEVEEHIKNINEKDEYEKD